MNTGIAYMSKVQLQRLNSDGVVLYEETFSILDSFSNYEKLSSLALSLLSEEDFIQRCSDFTSWIKDIYLNTSLEVVSDPSIDYNSISCPLPSIDWEVKDETLYPTTLKLKETGRKVLQTTFDKVGFIQEKDYFIEVNLLHEDSGFENLDYQEGSVGELLLKSEVKRSDIVMDINEDGELIIIGEDADHYYLNEMGELCYKY